MQQENASLENLADRLYETEVVVEPQTSEQKKRPNRFVDGIKEVFGRTAEYWSQFIPSEGFRDYLSDKLEYYDFDEMRKRQDKPLLNTGLVKKQYQRKGLLGAYEAFWGAWNKPAQRPIKAAYERLGGNEHPVRATLGAFAFSGFVMHALTPIMMPIYAINAASGNADDIPSIMVGITAFYVAAGIPVAYSKWNNQRKASK